MAKSKTGLQDRIDQLEDELKLRDDRIKELRADLDKAPSTRPKASASQSDSRRQLRVVEIRNDIGVRKSSAALNSGGSEVAR